MPSPTSAGQNERTTAAAFALKAHVVACEPEILAAFADGERLLQEIDGAVDLTEAPEDAVCSLVIDLMRYCEQENIDWNEDVISRARAQFQLEHQSKRAPQ